MKITGAGLKIWISNKLLTKLPILLAQIKSQNNSNKLKNKIRKTLYLLYQHNRITKNVYNKLSPYNHGRKYDSDNRCQKMLMRIWNMKLNLLWKAMNP